MIAEVQERWGCSAGILGYVLDRCLEGMGRGGMKAG